MLKVNIQGFLGMVPMACRTVVTSAQSMTVDFCCWALCALLRDAVSLCFEDIPEGGVLQWHFTLGLAGTGTGTNPRSWNNLYLNASWESSELQFFHNTGE